jgi:hypothetical protein
MGVEKHASRANLWTALGERALKVSDAFGWSIRPTELALSLIGALTWVGAMIYNALPWHVIGPVSVLALGSLLHLLGALLRLDPSKASANCLSQMRRPYAFRWNASTWIL